MAIVSEEEWAALEKNIRSLDDEALSRIAFWCWCEQVERDQIRNGNIFPDALPRGEDDE